jgi:hypothetical protein
MPINLLTVNKLFSFAGIFAPDFAGRQLTFHRSKNRFSDLYRIFPGFTREYFFI